MSKRTYFIICGLVLSVFTVSVAGCGMTYEYAKDEPFIIAAWHPAGPDDYRNMYSRNISIDQEGHLVLYSGESRRLKKEPEGHIFTKQLTDEQIDQVQAMIEEQKFWSIPEDVSTESQDGSFRRITVNLTDQTKTSGGLNPDHPQFEHIHRYIFNLVNNEEMETWTDEIEEYIWEMNPD